MKKMDDILENVMINAWIRHFRRSPRQINKPHETDVELVEISDECDSFLAATVDTVAEEIVTGIYHRGYTMGWVTVIASLSDLAAVGAVPLGLLISVSVDTRQGQVLVDEIAQGMEEACYLHSVFVLGGDTNAASDTSLTSSAFGLVPRNRYMTRIGCKPGDIVLATGRMGSGNALGFVRLTKCPAEMFPEEKYRPIARLKEGQVIRDYASCCMDTSDGLFSTLDQLMRLNGVGFSVECNWETLIAPDVLALCSKTQTPPWTMLAGPHGEFELVFTIPHEKMTEFTVRAEKEGINLTRVGEVQQTSDITLHWSSTHRINIDMAAIRNLLQVVGSDMNNYVAKFLKQGRMWGLT